MRVLDLGCGVAKREPGAIGIDIDPHSQADLRFDLTRFPWPLADSIADRIYLFHILEHQPDLMRFMKEVHRVARPGAEVIIETPHYSSWNSYGDPTHLHHLGYRSFEFFCRPEGGSPSCFRIEQLKITFGGSFLFDVPGRILFWLSPRQYEKHFAWIFPAMNLVCRLRVLQ